MPNGLFIERKPRELQALGPFSGTCQNAIILTGQYNNMTLKNVCHRPKDWKLQTFYDAIALCRCAFQIFPVMENDTLLCNAKKNFDRYTPLFLYFYPRLLD